jgi:translocon-associated protein subunit alpha
MYIILFTALGGLGYLGYNYLMNYLYPQQKRARSKRTTSSTTTTSKVVPADSGKPYPESVKPYEEDWVPAHHLKPAAAPRRRKGAKVTDGAVSAGEVTSGGEGVTSGAESGTERKKGKKGKRN